MPLTPAAQLALIADELAALDANPLSLRRTLLIASLLDTLADRVYAADRGAAARDRFGADDVLAFRSALAAEAPALAAVFAVCALAADGPHLGLEPVEVPIADYPSLSVADFMVSLYNRHTVQRVVIRCPGDRVEVAQPLLAAALAWWRHSGLV